jgi:hypothetical protein
MRSGHLDSRFGEAIIGIPLFIVAALLANRIWGVVIAPTRLGVLGLTPLARFAVPAITGTVDLILRARIPDAAR